MGGIESKTQAEVWCALDVPVSRRMGCSDSNKMKHPLGGGDQPVVEAGGGAALQLDASVNIRCSRLEELMGCREMQKNTICGQTQFRCKVLALPTTLGERGAPSVAARHLVDMLVANYSGTEIHNLCNQVIRVHTSRKRALLHDILACAARKLDTGTYHRRRPHSNNSEVDTNDGAGGGIWEVDRVCRWLSSLYTFRRNTFFSDNSSVSCREVLGQLRSRATPTTPTKDGDNGDDDGDHRLELDTGATTCAKMVVGEAEIREIFELWSEKHLKELSQGMPHYVDVDGSETMRPDAGEPSPILEDLLGDRAVAERCRKYFEVLALASQGSGRTQEASDRDSTASKATNLAHVTTSPRIDEQGIAQLLRACGFNPTQAQIEELCQGHITASYTLTEFTSLLSKWMQVNQHEKSGGTAQSPSSGQVLVLDAMK